MEKIILHDVVVRPSADLVFKTMWLKGDEDVKKYLERMVEFAIGRKLGEYTIGQNETGILNLKSIANKFDILLVNTGEKINIEMNRNIKGVKGIQQVNNRNLTYLGHLLADFYTGTNSNRYKENIRVEQVNFNNFKSIDQENIEKSDFELYDLKHKIKREDIKIHHIYLPRMKELCYDDFALDIYKDFALLMCDSYEEMDEIALDDKVREAVVKFLKKLGEDEEFMFSYVDEEWPEILRRTEMEEAREIAAKEIENAKKEVKNAKRENQNIKIEINLAKKELQKAKKEKELIIRNMFKKGIDVEDIADIIQLSVDNVKEILKG